MGCFYDSKEYGCNAKNCKGCINASNYNGIYGKRIRMTDKEIIQTCQDCSCYNECFENGQFDLTLAKDCYNIMFSC